MNRRSFLGMAAGLVGAVPGLALGLPPKGPSSQERTPYMRLPVRGVDPDLKGGQWVMFDLWPSGRWMGTRDGHTFRFSVDATIEERKYWIEVRRWERLQGIPFRVSGDTWFRVMEEVYGRGILVGCPFPE